MTPASTIVGGLIAGSGRLPAALTVEEVVAALEELRTSPTCWVPTPFPDDAAMEQRTYAIGRPVARWLPPDPAVTAEVAGVLEQGWQLAQLQPGSAWAPPALRFEVDSFDDLQALRQVGELDGWRIVGHVGMRSWRVSWSWPLRVTAPDAAGLDALRSTLEHDRYYRVAEAAAGDVVDIVVVDPRSIDFLGQVVATVAIVVDAGSFDPSELLDQARGMGLAGVLLVPDSHPTGLVDALVREMAHDEPLDVAASLVAPDATLVAGPELLGISSIRTWASFVAEQIGSSAGVGATVRDIVRSAPFDRESRGGEAVLAALSSVPEDELRSLTTIELQMAAAPPPMMDDEAAPRGLPDDLTESGDSDSAMPPSMPPPPPAEAPRTEAPPASRDERRLQAKLTDSSGAVRVDAFVADQRHDLRVRIAREALPDVVVADAVFRHPVAGEEVELSVVVRVRGQGGKPTRRTLTLPATADSKWTRPIKVRVPADVTSVAIEIVVLHEGRTVQSAVMSGPVVPAGAEADESRRLVLSVDADTPPAAMAGRASAAATLLVTSGVSGEPQVLDLSAGGRLLPADRLDKASKAVRRILFDTFLSPPEDLRGAAGPLTKLAVWGATLRKQLKSFAGGFHDDDPWIHVVSFGDALIPFELIYTHEMPDSDDEVPVCDAALGGATECTADCADRQRSDVVCPFGFWATSKVVERRVHVDNRTRSTPAVQRKVAVISGAVVGTSTKADEQDNTSSARIAAAIEAAVPKDKFRRVMTWKQLSEAVDVGRPGVVVLVTHTIKSPNEEDDLSVKFELGGDAHPAHRIDDTFVNPGLREPGPVVVSLGCDTGDLDVGFADWVATLHAAGAEVVVSTLSPVPGKEVALFIERLFTLLPQQFAGEPPHRFGEVLTAVRRATVATGDVLALSVTASGDGDVELVGAS